MKQRTVNRNMALVVGTLFAFPTVYFIFISLLKYVLGAPYLFDTAEPLLERLGIKESLGWNMNLLILFGPLIAMFINLLSVLRIDWYNARDAFSFKVSIEKLWWNMLLIVLSGILLATLFIYAMGENCRC